MIKIRQYIQLSLLLLLLFVLFQFSSYSISFYSKNDASNTQDMNKKAGYELISNKKDILVVTGGNEEAAFQITQELSYMKRSYLLKDNLYSVTEDEKNKLNRIILASDSMKGNYDLETIQAYINQGIHIIVAVLPVEELDDGWKEVLGIARINYNDSQVGILAFDGFLLGGKQDYKNLIVDAPYVKVTSSCKTYIVGYREKKEKAKVRQFDYIYDIVWRNIYKDSQIYVINGSGIKEFGYGILSAIFAQIYPDYLYPVINAKALIINNAPYLTKENTDEMMKRYTRNAKRFFADLAFPNIISVNLTYQCIPSLYGVSSFDLQSADNKDYDTSLLSLYQEDLNRIGGEIGISAYDLQNPSAREKVLADIQRFGNVLGNSSLKSLNVSQYDKDSRDALVDEVEKQMTLESVVSYAEEGTTFSYYKDDIVNVPIISKGFGYSEEEYFKLQSMVTALGVISHEVDMKNIIYPKNPGDDWTQAVTNLSSMLDSYWKPYQAFESMNVTQMSKRISRFLDMSPEITVKNNTIQVKIHHFDTEAFFILRTGKEVSQITNGSYSIIEDGVYLITAREADLTIHLN